MSSTPVGGIFELGEPYERYVGRWSRKVAPLFLDWLNVPSGRDWLDIGCGTGNLCAAILDKCAPAAVTGIEPSEGFLRTAIARLNGRAILQTGTAADIPCPDASVDVVASALVMNFVPDTAAAMKEISRVLRNGGIAAAYVWDYAGGMQMMRHFWEVAATVDPQAAALDESIRFGLCSQQGLHDLWQSASMSDIETCGIEIPTLFADFDDYWSPFLGGQGPAPAYVKTLEDARRDALREAIRQRLPVSEDGSIALTARAWAVRGRIRR